MNLNTKDFKNYKINGVIKINNVFSSKEISLLKKRINVYIKKKRSKLKGKEINWTIGHHVEAEAIQHAFKIRDSKLPYPIGVGALQPSAYKDVVKKMIVPMSWSILIIFAIQMVRFTMAKNTLVYQGNITKTNRNLRYIFQLSKIYFGIEFHRKRPQFCANQGSRAVHCAIQIYQSPIIKKVRIDVHIFYLTNCADFRQKAPLGNARTPIPLSPNRQWAPPDANLTNFM